MENSNRLIEFDREKEEDTVYISHIIDIIDNNTRKETDRSINWDKVIPELRFLIELIKTKENGKLK